MCIRDRYNIRSNGKSAGRQVTANIDIVPKEGGKGIDIYIKPGTKNESVHIPAIVTQSGINDIVYNDFHIGDDADVLIVACLLYTSINTIRHSLEIMKNSGYETECRVNETENGYEIVIDLPYQNKEREKEVI